MLPIRQGTQIAISRQHAPAAILQVGDSGWTAPMPLESGAQGEGTEQLNTRPVLVRAKIPSWGTMHEVVARLDLVGGGFARTMVSTRCRRMQSLPMLPECKRDSCACIFAATS